MTAESTPAPTAPGSQLRRLASAVVPDAGKRAIDALRSRYVMAIVAPVNREYVRRYGLRVTSGPFEGMDYLPGLEGTAGDLTSQLTGRYEAQLHPALETWRGADIDLVVNIGCAEGYYAVGLARMLPNARVLAYDIDAAARARCAELASLNDVSDRVTVGSECTPEALAALPASAVAVFCDCEGCEKTLLDPQRAPSLHGSRLIVELHDFIDPTITATILERFGPSHEIELIPSPPSAQIAPELSFMSARQRKIVLSEHRPTQMSWAILSPRA